MADERRGIEVFDGDGPDGEKFVEATVDLLIRTFPELRDCERAWIEKQIDSTSAFILESHRRGDRETIKKPVQSVGSPNPKGSPCPTCYGTGETLDDDGNKTLNALPCEDCLGGGREMEGCPLCMGTGKNIPGDIECHECSGKGKRIKLKPADMGVAGGLVSPGMPMLSPKQIGDRPGQVRAKQIRDMCQHCGGTGKDAHNQCEVCLGTGRRDPDDPDHMLRMKNLATKHEPEE